MSNLKSLAFTAIPRTEKSPALIRRQKLIGRLEEQKALAKDPTYVRLVRKWLQKDGQRVLDERKVPVRPWWKADEKGQLVLSVMAGFKALEFEKGKGGIMVGAPEKLPVVIDTLIAAIRAGELDSLLEQRSRAQPTPKAKAA